MSFGLQLCCLTSELKHQSKFGKTQSSETLAHYEHFPAPDEQSSGADLAHLGLSRYRQRTETQRFYLRSVAPQDYDFITPAQENFRNKAQG